MPEVDLSGQVAIVTGAGRGLGRSHAQLLADRGARVVVNDVAGAAEAADAIRETGGDAAANGDDISQPAGAAALVAATVEAFGTVDCLVNNAGIGRFTTMSEVTVDEYELVRGAGLDGTFYVTREVWPILAEKKYGRIVVTSSANGLLGNPASISYSIAKAGVFGMMRAASIDGADLGIKINSIGPAAATPMAEAYIDDEMAAKLRKEFPTSLVSPIVAVLASEQCPVSGEHFDVAAGHVGTSFVASTAGYYDRAMTPESILESWDTVFDRSAHEVYGNGFDSLEAIEIAKQRSADG